MTAVELLPAELATPDNPDWHKLRREGVTASEIAAVLGISPWDSPFSLYWQKVNDWRTEDNEQMTTGRRVEPVVADWWLDTHDPHENLVGTRAGLYAHPDRPWQRATPDRLIKMACPDCDGAGTYASPGGRLTFECPDCEGKAGPAVSVLECKWTGSWDGWGEPGTDDIPVYYRAQVLWQIDVLGVDEGHLAVLGPGGFRAYGPIRRDEQDLAVMREAGRRFVDRLDAGDPPDVDEHAATLATVKRLHPDLVDAEQEISPATAAGYRRARALKAAAARLCDRFEARLRVELGSNRVAVHDGAKVATRSIFDVARLDTTRLRAEQPEVAAAYATTSTTDRLTPARAKK
ncbi:YqaJ viral recombinase family protein [Micromonospora sp. NPDC020750]|uniref:YqaJ viral recombinase family nuclease n=1 Tax=unclassified Micromonospora TaxID=2617518 RepID=UPI00379D3355